MTSGSARGGSFWIYEKAKISYEIKGKKYYGRDVKDNVQIIKLIRLVACMREGGQPKSRYTAQLHTHMFSHVA